MASDTKTFLPGVRVHVNYKQLGSYYAPGTVARRNVDGTYAIDYDDGEKEQNVDPKLIFPYGNHPQPNSGVGSGGGGSSGGGGGAGGGAVEDALDGMSGTALCCICLFGCGFLAALVAFIVFGIMFLVQDQDVCEHFSPLFVFGVVFFVAPCCFNVVAFCCGAIIMASTKTPAELVYENDRRQAAQASGDFMVAAGAMYQMPPYWVLIACVMALSLYGLVTIYAGYTCDEMKEEPLYIWAQVAAWYLSVVVLMFLVAYHATAGAYRRWEKEYDEKIKAGGTAPTSEATPLVGGDLEAQKSQ